MALAEKKDDLWDLCQKYIDRNGVIDESIADAVATHPYWLYDDNRSGEFLCGIAQLVGYAHPETLLAKIEQQEIEEAVNA